MAYYSYFPPYVSVAERRLQAAREVQKLTGKGITVEPVKLAGRIIASSTWGKGWCSHLEKYSDHYNRLERGRTYVRNGSVVHLTISQGQVEALVSGSKLYRVQVTIKPMITEKWRTMVKKCHGQVASLIDLLAGKFSDGVMRILAHPQEGLFPQSGEITFSCSCPDYAGMCKHVAAVLYGVGARLDQRPELLFKLRGVEETELIAQALDRADLTSSSNAHRVMADSEDLSDLFGIEIDSSVPVGKAGSPGKRNALAVPVAAKTSEKVAANTSGKASEKTLAKTTAKIVAKTSGKALAKTLTKTPAKIAAQAAGKASAKTSVKASAKTAAQTAGNALEKTAAKISPKISAKTSAKGSARKTMKTSALTKASEVSGWQRKALSSPVLPAVKKATPKVSKNHSGSKPAGVPKNSGKSTTQRRGVQSVKGIPALKSGGASQKNALVSAKELLACGLSRNDIAGLLRTMVLLPYSWGVYEKCVSNSKFKAILTQITR
jgi:uncharacterized Zn finger protein